MTLKSLSKKINKLRPRLHERYHVAAMYVFGSVARGTSKSSSDIDFLVEFSSDEIGLFEFVDLKQFLENQLGCKVDLVTRDALKQWMKADVEEQAIRVA